MPDVSAVVTNSKEHYSFGSAIVRYRCSWKGLTNYATVYFTTEQ